MEPRWAKESTELRKSIRIAQVEEFTKSDAAFDDYLLTLPLGRAAPCLTERPSRQAISQVRWMMSGGVTFALSLLMYIFAAALLCSGFVVAASDLGNQTVPRMTTSTNMAPVRNALVLPSWPAL